MKREETPKKTDYYRCRLCGQRSPLSAVHCGNTGCAAMLSLYGEIETEAAPVTAAPEDPVYSGVQPPSTPAAEPPLPKKSKQAKKPKQVKRPKQTKKSPAAGSVSRPKDAAPEKNTVFRWKLAAFSSLAAALVGAAVLVLLLIGSSNTASDDARTISRLTGENNDLQTKITDLETIHQNLQQEKADLETGNQSLQSEKADLETSNQNLQTELTDLQADHSKLESDYNSMKSKRDALKRRNDSLEEFFTNNGLDRLHKIEITDVYNRNRSTGKKIDNNLTADTMDQLCIQITITAADVENRWQHPLEAKFRSSDEYRFSWTVDPGKKYGDETGSVSWNLMATITTPGTYVIDFYHQGFWIMSKEITIK